MERLPSGPRELPETNTNTGFRSFKEKKTDSSKGSSGKKIEASDIKNKNNSSFIRSNANRLIIGGTLLTCSGVSVGIGIFCTTIGLLSRGKSRPYDKEVYRGVMKEIGKDFLTPKAKSLLKDQLRLVYEAENFDPKKHEDPVGYVKDLTERKDKLRAKNLKLRKKMQNKEMPQDAITQLKSVNERSQISVNKCSIVMNNMSLQSFIDFLGNSKSGFQGLVEKYAKNEEEKFALAKDKCEETISNNTRYLDDPKITIKGIPVHKNQAQEQIIQICKKAMDDISETDKAEAKGHLDNIKNQFGEDTRPNWKSVEESVNFIAEAVARNQL